MNFIIGTFRSILCCSVVMIYTIVCPAQSGRIIDHDKPDPGGRPEKSHEFRGSTVESGDKSREPPSGSRERPDVERSRQNGAPPSNRPAPARPSTTSLPRQLATAPEELTDETIVAFRQLIAAKWLKNMAVGSAAYLAWEKLMTAYGLYGNYGGKKNPEAVVGAIEMFNKETWNDLVDQLKDATNLNPAISKNLDFTIFQLEEKAREYRQQNRDTRQLNKELKFWKDYQNALNRSSRITVFMQSDMSVDYSVFLPRRPLLNVYQASRITFDHVRFNEDGRLGFYVKFEVEYIPLVVPLDAPIFVKVVFKFQDDRVLKDFDDSYCDSDGNVAFWAKAFPLKQSKESYSIFVPYDELHLDTRETSWDIKCLFEIWSQDYLLLESQPRLQTFPRKRIYGY